MAKHKLDILVPVYNESEEVVKPLLDSIQLQQNVNFDEIGVIICCDGGSARISDLLMSIYDYDIKFYVEEHRGVSATRNACLDKSEAEYVMFCDADDMFLSNVGLWMIFNEINNSGFDTLVSAFLEETRNPADKKQVMYVPHEMDSTFVHAKVHRRQFLLDNNIRWNDSLTIHEDSYFNCLCQKLADPERAKYCPMPYYLWKWRDESVCRHDPKYILKTYNNMLDSNTALVNQFLERNREDDAKFYATSMITDAYYTLNKDEWINQDNQEYRRNTELRFKKYWQDFKHLYESVDLGVKYQITAGIRQRFFAEGLLHETQTFDQWIKHIEEMEDNHEN